MISGCGGQSGGSGAVPTALLSVQNRLQVTHTHLLVVRWHYIIEQLEYIPYGVEELYAATRKTSGISVLSTSDPPKQGWFSREALAQRADCQDQLPRCQQSQ